MARDDLTTYEVWLNEDGVSGRPILLYRFQAEVGLSDATVYTQAAARLQDVIDKLTTPAPDSLFVKVGVIHPPGVSVRQQRWQDNTDAVNDGSDPA